MGLEAKSEVWFLWLVEEVAYVEGITSSKHQTRVHSLDPRGFFDDLASNVELSSQVDERSQSIFSSKSCIKGLSIDALKFSVCVIVNFDSMSASVLVLSTNCNEISLCFISDEGIIGELSVNELSVQFCDLVEVIFQLKAEVVVVLDVEVEWVYQVSSTSTVIVESNLQKNSYFLSIFRNH